MIIHSFCTHLYVLSLRKNTFLLFYPAAQYKGQQGIINQVHPVDAYFREKG